MTSFPGIRADDVPNKQSLGTPRLQMSPALKYHKRKLRDLARMQAIS